MKEQLNIKVNIFEDKKVQEVHERLHGVIRAGWEKRNVTNPETVFEHTEALINLIDLWGVELGIKNPERLKNQLRIHDWPEILEGDGLVYQYEGQEYADRKKEKHARELKAMEALCAPLGKNGRVILRLYTEFENNTDTDAIIGHELDKVQAIIKCFLYEKEGQPVSTQEFIDEANKRNSVQNHFLLHVIKKIQEELPIQK